MYNTKFLISTKFQFLTIFVFHTYTYIQLYIIFMSYCIHGIIDKLNNCNLICQKGSYTWTVS